ncbi:esterase/lipase family protein [Adhaeretor mobilis]|nr:alpha/beta fold hydrolase [Adhaeretor mobilis]
MLRFLHFNTRQFDTGRPATASRFTTATILFAVILSTCAGQLQAADASAEVDAESQWITVAKPVVREATDYGFKRWLRSRVYKHADDAKFGLSLHECCKEAEESLPLVIQVHGFNSCYERNAAVMEPFIERQYPCGGFTYPNDFSLSESAERLSRELRQQAKECPERRVALITHSMGGLVARACLEDPELNPGNVDHLLMLAPPSQGTMVAHFAVATDVWEHWLSRKQGGAWARWRDSVVDGLGEAADDLVPGSPFLTQLNARPRNPDIQYSIFLGTAATMSNDEMAWIRNAIRKTGSKLPGISGSAERLERLLEDMDEVVEGKGDGIVAVERGRLKGVDDIVILPFGHLSVTGKAETDPIRQVQAALLSRLE